MCVNPLHLSSQVILMPKKHCFPRIRRLKAFSTAARNQWFVRLMSSYYVQLIGSHISPLQLSGTSASFSVNLEGKFDHLAIGPDTPKSVVIEEVKKRMTINVQPWMLDPRVSASSSSLSFAPIATSPIAGKATYGSGSSLRAHVVPNNEQRKKIAPHAGVRCESESLRLLCSDGVIDFEAYLKELKAEEGSKARSAESLSTSPLVDVDKVENERENMEDEEPEEPKCNEVLSLDPNTCTILWDLLRSCDTSKETCKAIYRKLAEIDASVTPEMFPAVKEEVAKYLRSTYTPPRRALNADHENIATSPMIGKDVDSDSEDMHMDEESNGDEQNQGDANSAARAASASSGKILGSSPPARHTRSRGQNLGKRQAGDMESTSVHVADDEPRLDPLLNRPRKNSNR